MIVIDVETTGLNPNKHSLISIGAVDLANPDVRFSEECRIWDGAEIDPMALLVNGFSAEEVVLDTKQSEAKLIESFFEWLLDREDMTPAGQNPLFDLGFIQSASSRAGAVNFLPYRSIDMHSLCYGHMVRRGITPPVLNKKTDLGSDKIMEYVGIPREPKPNIALNGAIWEAEAFSRLLYNKNLLPQFADFPISWRV